MHAPVCHICVIQEVRKGDHPNSLLGGEAERLSGLPHLMAVDGVDVCDHADVTLVPEQSLWRGKVE